MSRVKHLFAVVLAALMLCLLMPVAAFAEEASDGKMIVYAKLHQIVQIRTHSFS
jgi:hypothetical protein